MFIIIIIIIIITVWASKLLARAMASCHPQKSISRVKTQIGTWRMFSRLATHGIYHQEPTLVKLVIFV
jgi:hypothetical protein